MPDVEINAERLLATIDRISRFSDAPHPAVTRVLYTATDVAARNYCRDLARAAGLAWREDALGNLFVRLPGREPDLPAVGTGSHTDAIPYAGRYDGVVGALGGLEALRSMQEAGLKPRRSLELIIFTSEEPTRFGVGCLGSRAMTGLMDADALGALRDAEDVSLEQARQDAGFAGSLASVVLPRDAYAYFVELHIEQAPRLEAADVMIGVVEAIVASATVRVRIAGGGGHAGTVLMRDRCDALAAAAELVLLAERVARDDARPDAVATVGLLQVHPGASNSIPSAVELTLDVRETRMQVRDALLDAMRQGLATIARARGVDVTWDVLASDPSSQSDPRILTAIEQSAETLGLSHMRLVSRAYHDTVFMAQRFPAAMIFIPSFKGYSHRPEEYSAPAEIVAGVKTLAATLLRLAET